MSAERKAEKQFVEYVTSTAFVLTLSKAQAVMLYFLAKYGYAKGHLMWTAWREQSQARNDWVTVADALIRRGLLYHNWVDARMQPEGWSAEKHDYYRVTEAGQLVASLIALTGVISKPRLKAKTA
jgi:hypothetical protein